MIRIALKDNSEQKGSINLFESLEYIFPVKFELINRMPKSLRSFDAIVDNKSTIEDLLLYKNKGISAFCIFFDNQRVNNQIEIEEIKFNENLALEKILWHKRLPRCWLKKASKP